MDMEQFGNNCIFKEDELDILKQMAGIYIPKPKPYKFDFFNEIIDDKEDLKDHEDGNAEDGIEENEDMPIEAALDAIKNYISQSFNNLKSMDDRNSFFCALSEHSYSFNKSVIDKCFIKTLFFMGHLKKPTLERILKLLSTIKVDKDVFVNYFHEIPYGILKPIPSDISHVRKVLDQTTYGLKEAKQKVIEHLVLSIHSEGRGMPDPLLLAGPPGTGKTALSHSIAKALDLPFAKYSMASAFDTMMFRGSSAGWRNASPGILIKELINAKCTNPVWLWDEVDKAGSYSGGRLVDILAELFDPKMAKEYRDTFLEAPIDLSRVFNISTANDVDAIPSYILDRCNIITVRPYDAEERRIIIKNYLPVQLREEMRLPFRIDITEDVACSVADLKSLRIAKRVIKSMIARKLEKIRPGEARYLLLDQFDENISFTSEEKSIGFKI